MSEQSNQKHLERERLSALVDEPAGDAEASAHLEACTRCRAEFEHLSRMRMALSGLGDLEPPPDEWRRIEATLETRGVLAEATSGGARRDESGSSGATVRGQVAFPLQLLGRWPVQAAAAFLLFAGGILAGLQLTGGGSGSVGRVAGGLPAVRGAEGAGAEASDLLAADAEAAYLQALEELDRLRAPGVQQVGGWLDPATAAERLARLEALIRASREAVRENPADPVANALLFQLVEERELVASRLNESLRLATLEYR